MTNGKKGKLREPEARILALQIAATFPNHQATTEQIKAAIPKCRELSEADLKPSSTRLNEHMWEQIVGNIVSHKDSSRSLFNMGYAVRTRDGIRVTEKGITFLKGKGLYE